MNILTSGRLGTMTRTVINAVTSIIARRRRIIAAGADVRV
jgi:Flp pilus assembly CpaF family ATPase